VFARACGQPRACATGPLERGAPAAYDSSYATTNPLAKISESDYLEGGLTNTSMGIHLEYLLQPRMSPS
jgi:hypothetical protein